MAKEITVRVSADPSAFMQAIGQINGALEKADKQARKTSAGFTAFGNSLTSIGTGLTAAISLPLIGLGAASIKASADMEVLSMGLTSVMKSSTAAGAEMVKLKELARLPGLDLEGAVRGSIRLQTLGRSADSSRRIMGELANAIAIAGGGKDDFAEVTRQLSQMQSVGKVTKENLDTITERIPAISKIMLDTWGPQSLGDPAKFFEKAGISSAQFIEIMTDALEKGKRAGASFKNSFENTVSDANQALVEFGDALKPIAQQFLDDFATPVIKEVTSLAKAFKELPDSTKTISVVTAAIVAAVPIAVVALGSFLTHLGTVKTAVSGTIGALVALGKSFTLFGGLVTAGISMLATAIVRDLPEIIKALDPKNWNDKAFTSFTGKSREMEESLRALTSTVGGLAGAPSTFQILSDSTNTLRSSILGLTKPTEDASKATEELTKRMPPLARVTTASEILMRSMAEATQAHAKQLDIATDITRLYGTVNAETAIKAAAAWDKFFDVMVRGDLAAPPDLFQKFNFKDIPKFDGSIQAVPWLGTGTTGSKSTGLGTVMAGMGKEIEERFKASGKAAQAALRQVSTAVTDLSRGISDVLYEGGKFGDMLTSVAMQASKSITRLLIEGSLTQLGKKLLDVGGLFGKVFGGGTGAIMSAVPGLNSTINAAGGIGGGIGSATGGVGGAVKGVSSGIMGAIGAIGSAVSAVSGIIGNIQNAKLEGTMNQVERNTAAGSIHLLNTLNKANEYWPYLKMIHERLFEMQSGGGLAVVGGGGSVNVSMAGAYLMSDSQMGDFADRLVRFIKAKL